MRQTLRLLQATVKSPRYLTPGNPTGLTGLFTHPSPRSHLIYIYSLTLDGLSHLPPYSAYRAATESLTKQRLALVESIKPAGWDEWSARAQKKIQKHPEVFNTPKGATPHDEGKNVRVQLGNKEFVVTQLREEGDVREVEWDGEEVDRDAGPMDVGRLTKVAEARPGSDQKTVEWEPEPVLQANEVEELETKIGGGLIEEVIQVAEGELKLVGTMLEHRVWEELQEKPAEGQWNYFTRDQFTGETNAPPGGTKN